MRWPRGKYNGQRIVGFEVSFEFNADMTGYWWPMFRRNHGEPFLIWLWFIMRAKAEYSRRELSSGDHG